MMLAKSQEKRLSKQKEWNRWYNKSRKIC